MSSNSLATTLAQLIQAKVARDDRHFTPAALAREIKVDRSLIQRLLNGDVKNPRIDTLIKIAQYFIKDGFNLRIDDLIGLSQSMLDVTSQPLMEESAITLPLYQMEHFEGVKIGTASVTLPNPSPGLIAIVSHKDIEPMFKAGSLFIIDTIKTPIHDHLVAIKEASTIHIRKLLKTKNTLKTKLLGKKATEKNVKKNDILGVVVRINAKT